jgi:hypothetical protein
MKSSFWPYGIIITFVVFIVATIGLVVMASSQKVDLVSNDYYEQEIKYQSRIDSAGRAKHLDATIRYDAAASRIIISLPPSQVGKTVTGQIQLYRPSAAGLDRQFKFHPDTNGTQSLDTTALQNGLWKIRLSWNVASQDFFQERALVIESAQKFVAK